MTTPTTLGSLLRHHKTNQAALAAHCGVSKASISLVIAKQQWPSTEHVAQQIEAGIFTFFTGKLVASADIQTAINLAKPQPIINAVNPTEEIMLLQHEHLNEETINHFGLKNDPFFGEMASMQDVYFSPELRQYFERIWNVAKTSGFAAVVGESGSGKSTLRKYFEGKIKKEGAPIIIIQPSVLGMEENDNKGKTLKAASITEAIIRTLAPSAVIKSTQEAKSRQMTDLLKASAETGNKHVLIIEEAQCLPPSTLKHLKRYGELGEGFDNLLGVILIGQQELVMRLAPNNAEVREVAQRCRIFMLKPLGANLEGYLKHKVSRAGGKVDAIFDGAVYDAIREKLTTSSNKRGADSTSICHPLVVNNLVSRAMNYAVMLGMPKVTPEVIQEAA